MARRPSFAAMRDLPSGTALLALGREKLLNELLPLLPPERQRELRLLATAMAIAEREALAGDAPAQDILERLRRFYETPKHRHPRESGGPGASGHDLARDPWIPAFAGMTERSGGEGDPAGESPQLSPTPDGEELLRRFAADLRAGAFDACDTRGRDARAILWRLTMMKLREGNPQFLAENGFGE
jgi:Domain of unknown function (DUF6285)